MDDILHRCFEEFKYSPESEEARNRFNVYCDDKGQELELFATFRALSKYFAGQNPAPALWKDWPEAYKNPHSPEVEAFKRQHRSEIDYFKYTQWLCENQLQQVKENCLNSGMKIGLYMDTFDATQILWEMETDIEETKEYSEFNFASDDLRAQVMEARP